MFRLDWQGMEGEIGALMARFNELPRHIAKKHLQAVMKRVGKEGVPVLKTFTPVRSTRVLKSAGKKLRVRGGALRRAAMVKSRYKGRNKDGYVYGVLGYKYGTESRKGIWLEKGTKSGIAPRRMVANTMSKWNGPLLSKLTAEMATALEKAAAELASGMNPGVGKSGYGPGR